MPQYEVNGGWYEAGTRNEAIRLALGHPVAGARMVRRGGVAAPVIVPAARLPGRLIAAPALAPRPIGVVAAAAVPAALAPVAAPAPTRMQQAFLNLAPNYVKLNVAEIMKPVDNFVGHAPNKLGIGEKFKVTAYTTNIMISVAAIGGLRWEVISGAANAATDPMRGTITAVANDKNGVKLKLVGVTGALARQVILNELVIPVVEPSGAVAVARRRYREGGNGVASALMDLDYWLTPADVSFVGLEWREPGGEIAVATNSMSQVAAWVRGAAGRPNLLLHGGNPNAPMSIAKEHGGRTNYINQIDKVGNTFGHECAPGTFSWDHIKWQYRVKDPVGGWVDFMEAPHTFTVTGNDANPGTATITKLGQSHTEAWQL